MKQQMMQQSEETWQQRRESAQNSTIKDLKDQIMNLQHQLKRENLQKQEIEIER